MKVVATRPFVSTIYGNVASGRVMEVSDAHGRHFIENKLASEVKEPKETFTQPAPKQEPESIVSSQAGQVSQPKIVKKSKFGVAKKKKSLS